MQMIDTVISFFLLLIYQNIQLNIDAIKSRERHGRNQINNLIENH